MSKTVPPSLTSICTYTPRTRDGLIKRPILLRDDDDSPKYRAALSNPMLLEEVLIRRPRLRLYVMHAGWPMSDQMVALMWAHPQVYVDTGVIDWALPRKEFHAYLRRLVEAGFGKRIMFGSDQMVWPETIGMAVEGIESATFLTDAQKRDIFYNNAVRFFRLDEK